jgi:hypothetical protein
VPALTKLIGQSIFILSIPLNEASAVVVKLVAVEVVGTWVESRNHNGAPAVRNEATSHPHATDIPDIRRNRLGDDGIRRDRPFRRKYLAY